MYFDQFQSFEQQIETSSRFIITLHLNNAKASIESSPILISELRSIIAEYEIAIEAKSSFAIWDMEKVFVIPVSSIFGLEIRFV